MAYKFLISALFLSLLAPQESYAQIGGDQSTQVNIRSRSSSILPRNRYNLSFFDDPSVQSESGFIMRFMAEGVVAGCAQMKKGRIPFAQRDLYKNVKDGAQVDFSSDRANVAIVDTRVDLNDREPRYSLSDCEIKNSVSFVDVPFDRDNLIERGIKKFEITSVIYGDFGQHEIDINKDRFIFKSPTPDSGEIWSTYWFFPPNSVTLIASKTKQGLDLKDVIREFGISHGLVPMDEALEGYTLPHTAKNYVIFADPRERFSSQLETSDSVPVGVVRSSRTIYGVNGPTEQEVVLDVSAIRPFAQKPN